MGKVDWMLRWFTLPSSSRLDEAFNNTATKNTACESYHPFLFSMVMHNFLQLRKMRPRLPKPLIYWVTSVHYRQARSLAGLFPLFSLHRGCSRMAIEHSNFRQYHQSSNRRLSMEWMAWPKRASLVPSWCPFHFKFSRWMIAFHNSEMSECLHLT